MDAFPVEERLELVGNASVVDESAAADVSRGNDSTARQLPDVELVDITHALHLHTSHPHTRTHSRTDGRARHSRPTADTGRPLRRSCSKLNRKGSSYSIAERRVPELIPVLSSEPAGDVSHKPGARLPLLSARPAVTPRNPQEGCYQFCCLVNSLPDNVISAPSLSTFRQRLKTFLFQASL